MQPSDDYPDLTRRVRDPLGYAYEVVAYRGYARSGLLRSRSREVPIVGVLSILENGRNQLHAERAVDEADAAAIIDRIASQIENGSFMPQGRDLLD